MEEKIIEEQIQGKITNQERKEIIKLLMPIILLSSMLIIVIITLLLMDRFEIPSNSAIGDFFSFIFRLFAQISVLCIFFDIIFIIKTILKIFSTGKNVIKRFGCLLLLIQISPFLFMLFLIYSVLISDFGISIPN